MFIDILLDTEILSIHPFIQFLALLSQHGCRECWSLPTAFERGDVYTQFIAGLTYKGTQSLTATLAIYLILFKVANSPRVTCIWFWNSTGEPGENEHRGEHANYIENRPQRDLNPEHSCCELTELQKYYAEDFFFFSL